MFAVHCAIAIIRIEVQSFRHNSTLLSYSINYRRQREITNLRCTLKRSVRLGRKYKLPLPEADFQCAVHSWQVELHQFQLAAGRPLAMCHRLQSPKTGHRHILIKINILNAETGVDLVANGLNISPSSVAVDCRLHVISLRYRLWRALWWRANACRYNAANLLLRSEMSWRNNFLG